MKLIAEKYEFIKNILGLLIITNSGYTNIYGMDKGKVHDLNGKEMS